MAKKIILNGIEYPLQFNMLVFAKWEEHTKLSISEMGDLLADTGSMSNVLKALALLYYAIEDYAIENVIQFDLSFDNFIRKIDMSDEKALSEMFAAIGGLNESENNRQPKKQLKK